ncbi:MAG: GAF domain-containing protein, partial [Anaerolineales bacterium]
MNKPDSFYQVFDTIIKYVVLIYQAIVAIALLVVPFLAFRYNQQPFLGVFVESTLVTNGTGDRDPAWTLYNQGQGLDIFGNQLTSLSFVDTTNNTAKMIYPRNYDDISFFLDGHLPGESIRTVFTSSDGVQKPFDTPLTSFPLSSLSRYFYIPYFLGLIYLGFGLWIFRIRHKETAGRAFAIVAASCALVLGCLFDLYTTHYMAWLWGIGLALIGASAINLGLVFPQETRLVVRFPLLRLVGYPVGFILAILNIYGLYSPDPRIYETFWQCSYLFIGLGIIFLLTMILYRARSSLSPVVRQQARIVLFGSGIAFTLITIWLLSSETPFPLEFNPYLYLLPLAIFPATTGYTVMRYRLLRTDYVIRRGLLYFFLTVMGLLSYILLAIALSLVFGTVIGPSNPLLIGVSVLVVVYLLNPLRTWLQEMIDAVFFRSEHAHQERLKVFTHELTNTTDLSSILRILRDQITVSLLPSQLHIYIYDPLNDQYVATADETKQVTSDIRFASDSSLPIVLREDALPLFVDMARPPQSIMSERGRLAILGAQLFVPLPGRDRLIGWLALGERLSGEAYASHDIAFLESLGSQSAVAFERAQVVNNMERRVSEMNALSRVAQGINITLNFDDTLELIYAQTLQVISGDDFHLTLYNKTGQYFHYAFCLENDERIPQKENLPLPSKTTLDQEVILSRRALLTQDFMGQSQIMGVTSNIRGLYAWLGVPLNTGAETIGSLSITSRDPSVTYTSNHMVLLQAIADQAAGAIVKSRLLQETQRRAQQLSTLNVITRQLTSTLDLQLLLKNILENAVGILSSEAGSLFLVDDETDEMIFQVTVGPVAANLVGQRLPAGTGAVGKAVITRQPVIINDVQTSIAYNPGTDKQTGYITRTILAVPMEVKDRVIGVIEIMNKKDGLPFVDDDQNLLSAFAGQAAVAIDNARLYTLTDQALTARVEELSVMQRIDRELNASLEVDRAMRITLEWAMRQSQAEAGAIGFVGEKGVRLVANQGYGNLLEKYQEDYLSPDHPAVSEAINSGQPQRTLFDRPDPRRAFLTSARSQL